MIFCSLHLKFKIDILSQITVTGVVVLDNFLLILMRGLGKISETTGSLVIDLTLDSMVLARLIAKTNLIPSLPGHRSLLTKG